MSLTRSVAIAAACVTLCSVPALAQNRPKACAIIANFESDGSFEPKQVRKATCEPSSVLLIAACNLDTANAHTFTVGKSMIHKSAHRSYELLAADVTLSVPKATNATTPGCAAKGVVLPPETDFKDGDLSKKQHGTYAYNGFGDSNAFDPDLDVTRPEGVHTPKGPRKPVPPPKPKPKGQ